MYNNFSGEKKSRSAAVIFLEIRGTAVEFRTAAAKKNIRDKSCAISFNCGSNGFG